MEAGRTDTYYQNEAKLMGTDDQFTFDEYGLIFRKESIDRFFEEFLREELSLAILYDGHYPILAGHPGTLRMHDKQ